MQILALTFSNGEVSLQEAPSPALAPGCIRVQTLHSAVSPGTEGNKVRAKLESAQSLGYSLCGRVMEVAAFLEAVRTGRPAIPARSQLATTLATLEALESLRTRQPRPVAVEALLDRP